jgi:hypothetical protein
LLHANRRAANDLSVGQIYLPADPLLRENRRYGRAIFPRP